MRPDLKLSLAALAGLNPANAQAAAHKCKICHSTAPFFDVVDFNKCAGGYAFGPADIAVKWYRCVACGFLFTPFFDDWTHQEFVRFLYNEDYVRVDPDYVAVRPRRLVDLVPKLLGPPHGLRILDYGSGAGIFVKGLAELGYDVTGYDPFSSPDRPRGTFDVITCFEVIEHSPDPLHVLRDMQSMLAEGGGILLSESLQPPNIEELRCSWWYCAPRNGHCSLFTARSLAVAAEWTGSLRFHAGGGVHAFTSPGPSRVTDLLARATGPNVTYLRLGAPDVAAAPGWHQVEQSVSGPFRWTADARLQWTCTTAASDVLEIEIPFVNRVYDGFAQKCEIVVDGRRAETSVGKATLVARILDAVPSDGRVKVELHTPEPKSPRELQGIADDRPLGLAIAVLT